MPLTDSLTNYRDAITEANSFISLAFRRNRSRRYILSVSERAFITDSAFLKVFIAWETFIEDSFIQYMMGELSILGNIVTRYVIPPNRQHAHSFVIGTLRYVDWSSPNIVRQLANLNFAPGNPFETYVGAINQDLLDLKTIRNAAAHLSSTTKPKLDALAARKLGAAPVSATVSMLLFSIDPLAITPGDTILTSYLNMLDVAAEGIANA